MKKLLLIFLTFHLSLFTCFAQGTWSPRNPLPNDSAMGQGISGFAIGNYGYAGLGNYSHFSITYDEFWQFDPSINSWTQKASFPGNARVSPANFVIGDNAYLVTGSVRSSGACVTECWQYNATTNTWTQKANFPGSARTYAVGFAIDSLGYVGTGANELTDFRKDFYAYHPSTDTWTRIADFPGIARSCASGFAVNGKGYVCFGQDSLFGGNYLNNDMWEYDPGTNAWSQKSSCPDVHMYCQSGFAICNNIYMGSGADSVGFDHRFWKYSTVSDSWAQVASVLGITKVQGAAFAIGDTGYYGFGFDSIGVMHNVFNSFFIPDSCNGYTGNNNITEVSGVLIYPNPFIDKCLITMPQGIGETPIFSLFNIEGVKQSADVQGNGQYYTLKSKNLKDGVYILSIEYMDKVYFEKLIIIN